MKIERRPKRIEIIYFTGTGGTRMAATLCRSSLIKHGAEVYDYEIDKKTKYFYQKADLYLFLYPVYACNAPRPIYEFIDHMPQGNGCRSAVISVSGGGEVTPNLGCRLHTVNRLQRKGYRVIYENMIVMPPNCLSPIPEDLSIRLLQVLPKKISIMMNDLMTGAYRRTKPDPFNRLCAFLGELIKTSLAQELFTRNIRVSEACNGCGLCANSCPMINIAMIKNRPVYEKNCCICLRCIYGCKQKAITFGFGNTLLIKDGYDLKTIKAKLQNRNLIPVSDMTHGYDMSGIRNYLKKPKNL